MRLRDWIKDSGVSVQAFARELKVERAMVYRYFDGSMPRVQTLRRIEILTNGLVGAEDFYHAALLKAGGEAEPAE